MAIPFGNSIDLGKNELLNARLQNLSAAPANPLDGLFYYDATTKTAQLYANGIWVTMGHLGEIFTAALLAKLNGIAAGANNYTHPGYTGKASGLYKVTVDALGHVSAATAVAKADITALGIPAQDTTYGVATPSANGLMSSTDKAKVDASYTSAQVDTAIAAAIATLIDSSPGALDTLNELAAALGDDPNFATTISNALANKVDKIAGKGLSTNDFTTALLDKLNGITPGANTRKYSVAVGTGSATSIVVTHNLNTQNVTVTLRETASPYNVVMTDVQITSVNTITLIFATAPTAGKYTVTVVG
ncbi:hypothetical protein LNN31_13515 [Acetobacterium wieringae]|uniref:Tail fiber protein n=1 Tax=Acetobacterium wieringae TaxID=52694 RepID=A0ABY6HCX6_9FIRM|nr:hypothetical protein [Acetobacterium wieringae]UYO61794.1 hypothetical protein LNN31_13515 [Acetobacterium wieringae]